MTALLISLLVFGALSLVPVTLVQVLYMESLRLRTRELPALVYFRDTLESRIGLKGESGVLTFSLIKHTIIAVMGALFLALTSRNDLRWTSQLVEACILSWFVMMATTYILPQLLYRRTECKWLTIFLPIVVGLAVLARPITALLSFLQSLSQIGDKREASSQEVTPEEHIEALISASTEGGLIEEDESKLLKSVVAFGTKTVREVMTPRPSIVATSADSTLEQLRQLVINEQFSRIPVYEESIDQIIGFIHVRDMFELEPDDRETRKVRDLVRPIRYVPETKPVNDMLREMQQDGAHMAIVIDEYGNTAGLATMEDMVEEIVGEIRDEHEPAHDVQPDGEGAYIVSGSFDLDHLNELVKFRAEEDTESTTVGGLVTEWLGHVPQPGEAVERDGIRIEILAGNELRVEQVRISKVEHAQNA